MATNPPRKPAHKPSPLQPYVDAGAPPEIMLEGHKVQQRPAMLHGIAAVIIAVGTAVGASVVAHEYYSTRASNLSAATQKVVQAEDALKSLPAPQKAP